MTLKYKLHLKDKKIQLNLFAKKYKEHSFMKVYGLIIIYKNYFNKFDYNFNKKKDNDGLN